MSFKWPWVSRRAYERVLHELAGAQVYTAQMQHRAERAHQSYDDLVKELLALKKVGFEPPAPIVPLMPPPKDVVAEAVTVMSKGNPFLYQHFSQYAAEQRREHLTEDEIADSIYGGEQVFDGVPG